MDEAETIDDLKANLDEYQKQLATVEDSLKQDPENQELISLKRDLNEVIILTNDLIKYKQSNEGIVLFVKVFLELLKQGVIHLEDIKDVDITTSIFIGRTCVVLYNGKQKYGEVVQVMGDQPNDLTVIELLGSREKCSLCLKDLRLLEPPLPAQCKPGSLVQALYGEDGYEDGYIYLFRRWYDCIINRQTEKGYIVTYKDYNTSEEVQRDRVKTKIKEVKEIVTPAGYVIPENLIIKKTDNEKEKLRKRKLVQTLKKQQKSQKEDEESYKRASNWRKFQKKVTNFEILIHILVWNQKQTGIYDGKEGRVDI
uniref:Tudor domain-containing protein n=1 Tax=Theileria annulata TaxID=5874 RepID=A0A3B0N1P2_THEAN